MAILILHSPRSGKVPYAEWLAPTNERLVIFTTPEAEVDAGPRGEIQRFSDYAVNGNLELEALKRHRLERFTVVIAKAEMDLVRAARLREYLGIAGQSVSSAIAFRDKLVMKTLAARAGIAVPPFQELLDPLGLVDFIEAHGLPLVVKPIDGSGSSGTAVLRQWPDVCRLLATGIPRGYEMEKFIPGEMCHIDGLVSGGKVVFAVASQYLNGCLAFQRNEAVGSYLLDPQSELAQRLIQFTKKTLAALPAPDCYSFHAEAFLTAQDELVLCEITSRTGGGRINETIRRAMGIDLDRAWIQAQCGMAYDAPQQNPLSHRNEGNLAPSGVLAGFVLIPPRDGILAAYPRSTWPDGVTELVRKHPEGTRCEAARKSADHVAAITVEGTNAHELRSRLVSAIHWFEREVQWG